jgi:hypothetical protein
MLRFICIEDWINKSYLTVFLGKIAGNNIFKRFLVQADVDIWLKAVEGKVTEKEWRDFFTSKGSSVALCTYLKSATKCDQNQMCRAK